MSLVQLLKMSQLVCFRNDMWMELPAKPFCLKSLTHTGTENSTSGCLCSSLALSCLLIKPQLYSLPVCRVIHHSTDTSLDTSVPVCEKKHSLPFFPKAGRKKKLHFPPRKALSPILYGISNYLQRLSCW